MSELTPKLSANTREYVGTNAFDDDKLERRQLAEKLTGYLERLNDGAVLAIDAPWGEGKTWFGRNWNKDLNDKEFKTIYIDSFEQDYIEDPFILLASELLEKIKKDGTASENKNFKKTATQVAKASLSTGAKIGVNLGARLLVGNIDLNEEFEKSIEEVGSYSADSISKIIENRFDNYNKEKESTIQFKEIVKKYSQKQDKPIVVFIDELDRCKPTFAVSLIERIKHYFDVPNMIFILLLNKEQLENAVQGVYGTNTDASKYLDKFINFYFKLPKQNKLDHISKARLKSFIQMTLSKYNFTRTRETESFETYLITWSFYFRLSLRDIEKCIALFAFTYPTGKVTWILTYLIVFKVKNRSLFTRLINNEPTAHKDAKSMVEEFIREARRIGDITDEERILPLYLEWHTAHETNFSDLGEKFKEFNLESMDWIEKKDYFSELAKMIDIDIER